MTPYWHFYTVGAGAFAIGLLCRWRSEELTGRRFLAKMLLLGGGSLVALPLSLQVMRYFGAP